MKYIVTGGAGFIGSHLCTALLADGHSVLCVDDFSTGTKENIIELKESNDFKCVEHDITEPLGDLVEEVDGIYHLACPASPVDYAAFPIKTLLTSSLGTKNVLDYAVKKKARVLFTSTSEVYGSPLEHPQVETYWGNVNSVGPRSCYDEGKRYAESLVTNYGGELGLDARIIRIFNTYGPRMRAYDGRVIPNFIRQALEGKEITIYGDGKQTRSFCYVDDMVKGLRGIMEADHVAGPVNWGNPEEVTMLELANLILELTKSKSSIIKKKLPIDDPTRRCPDISKGKALLGFEPTVSLEVGLGRMLESWV
jgi:UDP-glucuronate decarboxylase